MLMYLIIFVIVGFIVAKLLKNTKKAFLIFTCLAILCGIVYAPMWGLVSFGEMAFGYFIVVFTRD
ncbi:hypothetical protein [Arcobacter sp.]|uniref:hypothetical protein n=1 Tax=Arcobacter sp. TaxID=1872629 RepID=UPI003D136856